MNLFNVDVMHQSDFYQVRHFKTNYLDNHLSLPDANKSFAFCLMQSGYFEYHVHKKEFEVHVGRVLVLKPFHEYRLKLVDKYPDISTIIDFTHAFYQSVKENYHNEVNWFFNNMDLNSMLIPCNAALDYLHHRICEQTLKQLPDQLLTDDLVIQMVNNVMCTIGEKVGIHRVTLNIKKYHLATVEKAKLFIMQHFNEKITLQQLADHCCVSLFHFCRIFKTVMKISPYQYLNELRLQHASALLSGSGLPVTHIAFQCGFNSLEQFDAAFRYTFNCSPTGYRKNR